MPIPEKYHCFPFPKPNSLVNSKHFLHSQPEKYLTFLLRCILLPQKPNSALVPKLNSLVNNLLPFPSIVFDSALANARILHNLPRSLAAPHSTTHLQNCCWLLRSKPNSLPQKPLMPIPEKYHCFPFPKPNSLVNSKHFLHSQPEKYLTFLLRCILLPQKPKLCSCAETELSCE
jgi:hypothetical protein